MRIHVNWILINAPPECKTQHFEIFCKKIILLFCTQASICCGKTVTPKRIEINLSIMCTTLFRELDMKRKFDSFHTEEVYDDCCIFGKMRKEREIKRSQFICSMYVCAFTCLVVIVEFIRTPSNILSFLILRSS